MPFVFSTSVDIINAIRENVHLIEPKDMCSIFTTSSLKDNIDTIRYEQALLSICHAGPENKLFQGFQRYLNVITSRYLVPRIDLSSLFKSKHVLEPSSQVLLALALQSYVC